MLRKLENSLDAFSTVSIYMWPHEKFTNERRRCLFSLSLSPSVSISVLRAT